jgi:predicted nucleic acid-binding protein
MSVTVVDASAVAAVLFMEPKGEALSRKLDGKLIAPLLLPFELANVCHSKIRSQPGSAGTWLEQYRELPRLGIELVAVNMDVVPELAVRFDLTTFEAVYLQAALQYSAGLATLDEKLGAGFDAASK